MHGHSLTGSRLQTLSLSSMGPDRHELLKWLIHPECPIDLRELKEFIFHADIEIDHKMFCRLLSIIPSTLEHLTYRPPPQTIRANAMGLRLLNDFHLSRFPHLRSFTLYTHLSAREEFSEIGFSNWSAIFLLSLPKPSTLESLRMRCNWNTFASNRFISPESDDVRLRRWEDLDSFLSSEAFSNLSGVFLHLALEDGSRYKDPCRDAIAGRLHRLQRQGKLLIL
ncbi:hypothetical protein BDN72DRAFT_566737 [Pluteus cervinus]|uniref:Uncharacterized protein n=1 Tax=Pluteus cervinus TaxID=181527 RepID=A0ACD3AYT9_9AGAR|nr:hypothetical protein BDN72DRAFT_566737 [Pluteus cervinus]